VTSPHDASGGQCFVEDIAPGDEIPGLSITLSPVELFLFSAATHNGHRIHYDRRWATEQEGYPGLVVHGPLQTALLARVLTDWAGPAGQLLNLEVRNRAPAFDGQTLRLTATVVSKDDAIPGPLVKVALSVERLGPKGKIAEAEAVVRLPSRHVARSASA
jgi:acyl dehydratase